MHLLKLGKAASRRRDAADVFPLSRCSGRLGDSVAGVAEINRVLFDPDESLSRQDRGDAGGAAAQERIEDVAATYEITEVTGVEKWPRAWMRIVALASVPRFQVGDDLIAGSPTNPACPLIRASAQIIT